MEVESKSYAELQDIFSVVKAEISRRDAQEKVNAKNKVIELVKAYDLDLDELAKKVRPDTAKYRNPQNHAQTWSGRGKKPAWIIELINQGISMEDMMI